MVVVRMKGYPGWWRWLEKFGLVGVGVVVGVRLLYGDN